MGFPGGSDDKVSACNVGDPDSIPGSGRSPGEGNGNPLQYSNTWIHHEFGNRNFYRWAVGLHLFEWDTDYIEHVNICLMKIPGSLLL